MRIRAKALIGISSLLLAACSNAKEDEAERLGFSSALEMEQIHSKGWHTNAQYVADETERAKRLGFANMDELHDAEAEGILDPISYRKHKAAEEARLAAENAAEKVSDSNGDSSDRYQTDQRGALLSIDGGQLAGAIFQGKDDNGKTKEEYFIEFKRGENVKVYNAFIYAKDTSGTSSDAWYLRIGYNSPAITCKQTTEESKRELVKMPDRIEGATVIGRFEDIVMDRVYLYDCTITGGKAI